MPFWFPSQSLSRVAVGLVLLLLASACGKKGPVRPLEEPVPAAPVAPLAQQMGESVLVSWERPTTNLDGSPLDDLAGFQIWRMSFDPTEDCPECRDTSILLREVDLDYLRGIFQQDARLSWFDTAITSGTGYRYRITPVDADGQAGQPATLSLTTLIPPPPPTEVAASGHDRLVRLNWSAVAETRQGAELLGYFIFRRTPDSPFPPAPLNREPLTATVYEDFGLNNGTPYLYAVRSAVRLAGATVLSPRSPEAAATPAAGR